MRRRLLSTAILAAGVLLAIPRGSVRADAPPATAPANPPHSAPPSAAPSPAPSPAHTVAPGGVGAALDPVPGADRCTGYTFDGVGLDMPREALDRAVAASPV